VSIVTDEEPPAAPGVKPRRNERLLWVASLLLALLVACSGCSFFLTAGLVARGELTAQVLGTKLRLWAIREKRETGLGFDRAYEAAQNDGACVHHDVTILLWKPALSLESVAYDDCS